MHIWRHHEHSHPRIDVIGNAKVRMIEHRGCVEHDFENQNRRRRRTNDADNRQLESKRQQDFNGVKPASGGHIEIQICVVHAMHPPQRRHCVKDHMLDVDSEIENDERHYHRDHVRDSNVVEKSPAMFFGFESEADHARW